MYIIATQSSVAAGAGRDSERLPLEGLVACYGGERPSPYTHAYCCALNATRGADEDVFAGAFGTEFAAGGVGNIQYVCVYIYVYTGKNTLLLCLRVRILLYTKFVCVQKKRVYIYNI